MKKNFAKFFRVAFLIVFVFSILPFQSASAAPGDLTIEPNAWNIIGLDSNDPATGPFRFPIGAKVCNTTGSDITSVQVKFYFDSGTIDPSDAYAGDDYINLRTGSLESITIPTILANDCEDAFFEVEVLQNASAFDQTREYHIVVEEGTAEEISTPQPRELYVEHLISQNRNSVTDVVLDGVSYAAGSTMTLMVGNTYTIELHGGTATQGYNQFEDFINFPNTIFQILSVETEYSIPGPFTNPYPYLYADACSWDNDPDSPTYRSCIGSDFKSGGNNVVTTYVIKIIAGAGSTQELSTLLYDFSGSSFHYNSDFSVGSRFALIVGPSDVTIAKSFSPKAITAGASSTMTIKLTNPTPSAITGANFKDNFPAGLTLFDTTTSNTCGGTILDYGGGALNAGDTGISFSGGSIPANSNCTLTVHVTAASNGDYLNTTENLFIDVNGVNTDTGNNASDTLKAGSSQVCTSGTVTWVFATGFSTTSPVPSTDTLPGTPSAKPGDGITATAFTAGTDSWGSNGDITTGTTLVFANEEYVEFYLGSSGLTNLQLSFDAARKNTPNSPTGIAVYQGTTSLTTDGVEGNGGVSDPGTVAYAANSTVLPTGTTAFTSFGPMVLADGTQYLRIYIFNSGSTVSGFDAFMDNVTITGDACVSSPTLSKSFGTDPIQVGQTSQLTITINNNVLGASALTNLAFTDVLPIGLEINTPNGLAGTCDDLGPGGVVIATAGTDTIDVSSVDLAAGASCTVIVDVLGVDPGDYTNTTGFLSSTETGETTSYGTDTLQVIAPPVIEKSFDPTSIFVGETSTLTFTITNPNLTTTLTGVGFTDTLPAGITVPTAGAVGTCGGGSLTTTSPSTISFSGGSIPFNSSCTFSVTVTGITAGTWNNTTSAVTSTQGGPGNTASASIIVLDKNPSLDLTKQVQLYNGVSCNPLAGTWVNYLIVPTSTDICYRFLAYNSGDVDLVDVYVSDTTPLGLDMSSCNFDPLVMGDTGYCAAGPYTTDATAGEYDNNAVAHGTYLTTDDVSSNTATATYANPELTITKSATETYFTNDTDILHYSYVVENTGFAPILGPVTVTDDKVGSVSCQDVSAVGDFDNYLDVGESVNCPDGTTADYDVQPGDVTALEVTNQAYGTASGVQSNTDAVTVPLAPDLTVTKTNIVSNTVVFPNSFDWTLEVSNSSSAGTATFTDGQTILTDNLPTTGATYVAGTVVNGGTAPGGTGAISCSITTNVLTCTASGGPVTFGSGASFSIPVTVTPTTTGSLVNPDGAGVCRADPGNVIVELDDTNNNCSNTVAVSGAPNLGLTKSNGVTSVAPGGTTTYSLTVTNNGTASTSGTITVVDVLPTGLSITDNAGFTPAGTNGADWTCVASTNVISCTTTAVITASGGTSSFDVTVSVDANASGTLVNKAQVGGGGDPSNPNPPTSTTAGQCTTTDTPNEGCATDSDTVDVVIDVSLTKDVNDDIPNVSDVVTFTLTLANAGPSTATNVEVQDAIPSGYTYVTASIGSNAGATGATITETEGSGVLIWDVDALDPNESVTLTYDATVLSSGFYDNYVQVTAHDQIDSDSTFNNGQQTPDEDDDDIQTVTPNAVVDVSLTKDVNDDTPNVSDVVTFTLTLSNAGPSSATNVVVTDVVPSGYTYVIASINSNAGATGATITPNDSSPAGTGLTWSVNQLDSLESVTLTYQATVLASGTYDNYTQVTAHDQTDSDSTFNNGQQSPDEDDDDTQTVTPNAVADLSLAKSVNDPSPNVGDTVTYILTLTNSGPSTATNVEVTDVVPAGLTYVGLSIGSNAGATGATITPDDTADPTLVWDVDALDNGESVTLTYQATVSQAGTITNTAEVTDSDQTDPDSSLGNCGQAVEDDCDSETIGGIFDPPTALKTFDEAGLPQLEFRMVWINSGNAFAIDTQVTDNIPTGTTYVAASITCAPQGASTTAAGASAPLNTVGVVPISSCGYDPATNRIQWQGTIGPDNGNLTEAAAANEVVITFRVTVDDAVNQVQNQGFSRTDVNADQLFDEGVLGTSDVFSNQVIWNRSGLPAPVADPAEKLPKALPATGFAPNVITDLPQQPADKTYAATDVWLEIPNLAVNVAIVGVPLVNEKWDLSWLDNQAGWLEGTAFPSWQGNSAVTGHVTLPNGKSGPFAKLGNLEWGDTVIVHAYGYVYVYQVRENKTIAPNNTSVLKHEEKAWLTLITCKNYNEDKDLYSNRVAVRAILISVTKEAATAPSDRER